MGRAFHFNTSTAGGGDALTVTGFSVTQAAPAVAPSRPDLGGGGVLGAREDADADAAHDTVGESRPGVLGQLALVRAPSGPLE